MATPSYYKIIYSGQRPKKEEAGLAESLVTTVHIRCTDLTIGRSEAKLSSDISNKPQSVCLGDHRGLSRQHIRIKWDFKDQEWKVDVIGKPVRVKNITYDTGKTFVLASNKATPLKLGAVSLWFCPCKVPQAPIYLDA
eukprot:gb/GEZN01020587.1/.p1 GENE.gb/GEZN01020587.1/~~gb/GEZN01020587.1/.p1  ORF type:complete len:138 (+),score=7.64 gb/GEZN01020587.1/:52-465(+)